MEQNGIPLSKWEISINRGILTGYNEAFIISNEIKDKLVDYDPKSAELIRPILRGRDIKRYSYSFADLWLISTFPSKKYDINNFPGVKNHLLSFGICRLEQTGATHFIDGKKIRARKHTNNKWFETQDSIGYWDDFSKPKLIYADISQRLGFALDTNGFMLSNTAYFISSDNYNILKILCKYLNTKLLDWYYRTLSVQLGNSAVRMFSIYVLSIPIPKDQKIKEILQISNELEIENFVCESYNLTSEEMQYIAYL